MKFMGRNVLAGIAFTFCLSSASAQIENGSSNLYDDYSAFESDPVQLDEEVSRYFGRFFQTNILFGTGLFTGELGKANTAGLALGARFVFYFDKLWAGELGAGWNSHRTIYTDENTGLGPDFELDMDTLLIPITLGIRYAFDRDNLPKGISLMNPYVSVAGELIFRAEKVKAANTTGTTGPHKDRYTQGAVVNSNGYGFNFGGGFEFDVYKNKVFLGLDLRYHFLFWDDADLLIGTLGRNGHYFTILGMVSYNY